MKDAKIMTAEEISLAYALILGRKPESPEVIERRLKRSQTLSDLRYELLRSDEFLQKHPLMLENAPGAKANFEREPIVFLHLPKCGGTTLHSVLCTKLQQQIICPERHNALGNWPAGKLAEYELFSGHYDYNSLSLIPAKRLRVVTVFRRPEERLVSLYRFLRAHTIEANESSDQNNGLCELARKHDPVTFFSLPELRRHTSINNAMMRQLTQPVWQKRWDGYFPQRKSKEELIDKNPQKALELACQRVEEMTAFGLTEVMDISVPHILKSLNLGEIEGTPKAMATDEVAEANPLLRKVEPVILDDVLRKSLMDHVHLDLKLYEFVKATFYHRVKNLE